MSQSEHPSPPDKNGAVQDILHDESTSPHAKLSGIKGVVDDEEQLRWQLAWYAAEVSTKPEYSEDEKQGAKTLVREAQNRGIDVDTGDIVTCQQELIETQAEENQSDPTQSSYLQEDDEVGSEPEPETGKEPAAERTLNHSGKRTTPDESDHASTHNLAAFNRDIQTKVRDSPEDRYDHFERLTNESRLSQDHIGVDYVRDDGIAVRDDEFIGHAKVEPRNWHVLNPQRKEAVFQSYAQHLLSLTFPVQELHISKRMDLEDHKQQLVDADLNDPTAPPILRHSREKQAYFETNAVSQRDIMRNEHYIVVSVDKNHIDRFRDSGGNQRLPRLSRALSKISEFASRSSDADVSDEDCVKEVKARLRHVRDTLSQTGVTVDTLDSREDTMDLLYYVFNNAESPFDEYEHSTYTEYIHGVEGEFQ